MENRDAKAKKIPDSIAMFKILIKYMFISSIQMSIYLLLA